MDDITKPRSPCEANSAGAVGRTNGALLYGGQQRGSIQNQELSQLEEEIKKAYVLKTLNAQLAEQEANRMSADIQKRIAEEIERYRLDTEIEEQNRIIQTERLQRATELKAALDCQIEQKREERSLLEQEERNERRLLVEVDRIREEMEERQKILRKEELSQQIFMETAIQQEIREINKRKAEELEAEESVKNEKYVKELNVRAERLKKLRLEALKKREEATLAVAKMMLELESERNERRRLLSDFMLEEVKYQSDIDAQEMELRRKQNMKDLAQALEEQILFEQECKARFLEREKQFADAILAEIMKSQKMEQLSAEVKKRRKIAYREELESLMKERERALTEELNRLRAAFEEDRRKEEMDREEARKARMLLLQEHIDNIGEFMNRKSLYHEERSLLEGLRNKK